MSKGDFIRKSDLRVRLLIVIQILWGTALIVLALWWGTLIRQQSDEIAVLQTKLGVPESQVQSRLDRTERMVTGESGTFVVLILITNGILLFFFIRDSRRSKSLQSFFAAVTHEFRTPLTSIKLQAEALKDVEDNPNHKPYIDRLLEDVDRLDGQVQRTLELARIEGGGTLSLQSIPIKSFIQNRVLPSYQDSPEKIAIHCQLPEAAIQTDATALTIILRNLIDNAIKYSTSKPTQILISGEIKESFYFIDVTHLNSQFQGDRNSLGKLFYRGKNSQGAGVGLYLIETLMKKMKGFADFRPDDSKFTTHLTFTTISSEAKNGA